MARDWVKEGRFWRCEECVEPLMYHEIFQTMERERRILCGPCFVELPDGIEFAEVPKLCEVCGEGFSPFTSLTVTFNLPDDYCDICVTSVDPEQEEATVDALIKVLEATDEEG